MQCATVMPIVLEPQTKQIVRVALVLTLQDFATMFMVVLPEKTNWHVQVKYFRSFKILI